MNGSTWVVGGNFITAGRTLAATAEWILTVTGTAVASGIGSVAYSNAGAGTEIWAGAGPWTNALNNTNWDFGITANIQLGSDLDLEDQCMMVLPSSGVRVFM